MKQILAYVFGGFFILGTVSSIAEDKQQENEVAAVGETSTIEQATAEVAQVPQGETEATGFADLFWTTALIGGLAAAASLDWEEEGSDYDGGYSGGSSSARPNPCSWSSSVCGGDVQVTSFYEAADSAYNAYTSCLAQGYQEATCNQYYDQIGAYCDLGDEMAAGC